MTLYCMIGSILPVESKSKYFVFLLITDWNLKINLMKFKIHVLSYCICIKE